MGLYVDLVRAVFKYTFYLALTGQIGTAAYDMIHQAHYAQSQFVSLSSLNRQLVGGSAPKTHQKQYPAR